MFQAINLGVGAGRNKGTFSVHKINIHTQPEVAFYITLSFTWGKTLSISYGSEALVLDINGSCQQNAFLWDLLDSGIILCHILLFFHKNRMPGYWKHKFHKYILQKIKISLLNRYLLLCVCRKQRIENAL